MNKSNNLKPNKFCRYHVLAYRSRKNRPIHFLSAKTQIFAFSPSYKEKAE